MLERSVVVTLWQHITLRQLLGLREVRGGGARHLHHPQGKDVAENRQNINLKLNSIKYSTNMNY